MRFCIAISITFACSAIVPSAYAGLDFVIADDGAGAVNLTVTGTGTVSDGDDNVIRVGTATDTFLNDMQPFTEDMTPNPLGSLGGKNIATVFYAESNAINPLSGLESSIQFNFFFPVPANSNLSDLNGTYNLDDWVFADFIPGNYTLIESQLTGTNLMSGFGDITLSVVPEPSAFPLLGLVGIAFGGWQWKRRSKL